MSEVMAEMAELIGKCIGINKGKGFPAKCVAPSQLHRGQLR
jgi:hypothetical protein